MEITNLEQGTKEWHDFRSGGLGASEAAAALDFSPFMTPHKLWTIKCGFEDWPEGFQLQRGKDFEPIAREHYELERGFKVRDAVFQSDEYPFLFASLDGIVRPTNVTSGGRCVEIKNGSKELFEKAKHGVVPVYYNVQMQQQMLCSNTDLCDFWVFNGTEGALVEMEREPLFEKEYVPKLRSFWDMIQEGVEPKLTDRDWKIIEDEDAKLAANAWLAAKKNFDSAKAMLEKTRKAVLALDDHDRFKVGRVRVLKSYRKGSVDYSAITELKGVNLDAYRKPPIQTAKVDIEKK